MKVLLLGSLASSLINFRGNLIRDLVLAGCDVIVCSPDVSAKIGKEIESLGAQVIESPLARNGLSPIQDFRYFRSLCQIIAKNSPDLVISYTIKPNIWGAIAAHRRCVRSISMVTGVGYAFTDRHGVKKRIVAYIATILLRKSTAYNDIVIFQNRDDIEDFVRLGVLRNIEKARLVAGSGVDTEHFQPCDLPNKPVFLMISRLLKNKGVREYGQAAVSLKSKFPQARFLLVGWLDEGPDSIQQSELDEWVDGGVEYLGWMPDVRDVIRQASIYVLPSYREGTPRSVLEAMSMGRPIITSDAPGCRETVEHKKNGFLVPIRDSVKLAETMAILLDDSELRSRMGAVSLCIVRKKFDVKLVNKSIFEIIGLRNKKQ